VAIYTLEITEDYDFDLIGLSSHERDYRLAWSLNRNMGWSLIRLDDLICENKKGISSHPHFRYLNLSDQTIITLIDNKTQEGFFLPELSQFDYILKIENSRDPMDDHFLRKLKRTPFLMTAFQLEVDKLKSKRNLLFEYKR
jgi:hypothetical protein